MEGFSPVVRWARENLAARGLSPCNLNPASSDAMEPDLAVSGDSCEDEPKSLHSVCDFCVQLSSAVDLVSAAVFFSARFDTAPKSPLRSERAFKQV
jgi:hypothetical protein